MREMGLQSVSIYSKRDYQKSERLAKKQNMLQQQFKVDEPNRVWVSDITCFKVNGKYLYICVILDLFSRKVVAHRVSPKNSTYLVTSTFRQVYRNRNEPQQLMFHSDQGPQYTSNTFRKLLRINKVVQSFSKSSRPHDNAVAESFFASMKREEIYRTQYCSERQFMQSVDTYIEFYNTKRPHSTLNYRTPDRLNCSMRKGKNGQADLDKGFKTGYFSFFNHQACVFYLCDMNYRAVQEKRKHLKYQAFSHGIRVGVVTV